MQTKVTFSWPNFRIAPDWTLFLDRDGVINERRHMDYVRRWEEFKFLPGALEAIEIFNRYFARIVVVTNQAGIEKELMTHDDLKDIHERMIYTIDYHGGRIDEVYYCPFKADLDPLCRKPNPGMALEAKKDYPDIDFRKSVMIGDSDSDIVFGNNLEMRTILVGNKPDNNFSSPRATPDCRLDSILDYAYYLDGRQD
jgi:histidinol-phosphate phosphatase family protein